MAKNYNSYRSQYSRRTERSYQRNTVSPGYKPRSIKKFEDRTRKRLVFSIIFTIALMGFLVVWGIPWIIGGLSVINKHQSTPNQISEDAAIAPPVLDIPFDATNSSTIRITGYSAPNTKVEIYLDDDLKTTVSTNDDGSFATDDIMLSLGINRIYGKTVSTDTANNPKKSLSSKTIHLVYSNEKPTLDITSPSDNQQIIGGDKKVLVSGKTDTTNSLSVNGSTVIVNGDGNFSTYVSIGDGDTVITIIATNAVGSITKVERKVTYTSQP